MGFKELLFICSVYFLCTLKVSAQICVYQETFKGGVTGDSFNPWTANLSGQFDVYIEPGSTVKEAYLFVNVIGNPDDQVVIFNGNDLLLNQEEAMNNSYLLLNSSMMSWTMRTLVIDVQNYVDPNNNVYTLTPPQNQPTTLIPGIFSEYYLYIAYENPTLDFVSSAVFVNNIQPQQTQSYNLNNINPMNLTNNVSLALFTSSFCDTIEDGSFVSIDTSPIGLIGGDDDNSPIGCVGVSGSFYYQLGTAFGLGNDTPDPFMSGPDALATIENYILSTTAVNIELEYQDPTYDPQTNPVHQLYLAYTTPCDTFSVTVPNDTTVCEGTQLQLNATGGTSTGSLPTYEWTPSTGLSCNTCPNPIFTADSSMFYTVRIRNNDSCSVVRPLKINVRPKPTFGEVSTTTSECGASTGSITASTAGSITVLEELFAVDGNGTIFSSVSQNQSSATIGNLNAGNYTVYFIDTNGCQSADTTIYIDEINTTVADFSVSPQSGAAPLGVNITNTSQNASDFEWSLNSTSTGVTPPSYFDTSGTYEIMLVAWENDPSCADTMYKTIFVYDSLLVQIPNVFTPNRDGVNDFFSITSNMPLNCELVILNRWGNVVFEYNDKLSVGINNLWDASTSSATVLEGVYFYKLRFEASEETPDGVESFLPSSKEGFVHVER